RRRIESVNEDLCRLARTNERTREHEIDPHSERIETADGLPHLCRARLRDRTLGIVGPVAPADSRDRVTDEVQPASREVIRLVIVCRWCLRCRLRWSHRETPIAG